MKFEHKVVITLLLAGIISFTVLAYFCHPVMNEPALRSETNGK